MINSEPTHSQEQFEGGSASERGLGPAFVVKLLCSLLPSVLGVFWLRFRHSPHHVKLDLGDCKMIVL
jgi:hypothetical protein